MQDPDFRYRQLLDWLRHDLGCQPLDIAPASADASFRRYFRIRLEDGTRIVMDAPPPQENVRPFVAIAGLLREAGVQTPAVHAVDAERGFVLLGDFGDRDYLRALDDESAEALYGDALETLLALQRNVAVATAGLPAYDEALLRRELGLFREWLLERWLALALTPAEEALLADTLDLLVQSALEQPRVCVHRDYHSRNLMVTGTGNPGVLDFQDAVIGPLTYDLVSLLRDCYVVWPPARVQAWVDGYRDRLLAAGLLGAGEAGRFGRWFDLMGMQRHLKAAGIFVRLKLRDGKPGYLADIPRTLGYVAEVARAYPELTAFAGFLDQRVWPRLSAGERP